MIGCFPNPYPDEFIYSVLSRYNLISSNRSEHITSKELFSRPMWEIKMDLFPYAKKIEMKLEHFNFYNAVEIIEKFSFFNYYNNFSNYKDGLQKLMLEERSGRIKNELYCHNIEIYNADYYRICIECFEEESKSGVPYWHITHNLPGVTYCGKHNCKLVSSNVKFNGKKLIALSREVRLSELPLLNDREEKVVKLISQQTVYLFQKETPINKDTITPYISYLYEGSYIKEFILDEKSLINNFMEFYSDNICKMLNFDKEYVILTVIRRIREASSGDIHPLFHILFIIFCGKSIKDLNDNHLLAIPFNSNIFIKEICSCFDGFFIHNSVLRFRKEGLVGSFKCNCGKYYDMESWNKKVEVRYGEKFSEHLWELLFVENLSITEICSKLNVSKTELKNYLIVK